MVNTRLNAIWNGGIALLLIVPLAETFAPLSTWREAQRRVASSSSSAHDSTLFSTRGPRSQDYWEYEEERDEDSLSRSERYPPPVREKYVGGSQAETELKNMPLEADDYYLDDDDEDDVLKLDRPRRRDASPRRSKRDVDLYYDDADDEYDDPDGGTLEEGAMGNFWSNPDASLDPAPLVPSSRRPPPLSRTRRSTAAAPRKRKRTTFRSGIPEPPPPVKDLYNRLFWYGFDPDDTDSPADKTMFGGTKGKFNGLAFMYDGGPKMPADKRRRRPRNVVEEDDDEYYGPGGEDEDDYRLDSEVDPIDRARPKRAVTPPYDEPSTLPSDPTRVSSSQRLRRRQRRSRRSYEIDDAEDDSFRRPGNRRSSSQVSNWFDVDAEVDTDEDDDYENTSRSRRSRRRDDYEEEKPINPFEIFFGTNRENLSRQAEEYNRQMGLGVDEQRPRRRRNPRRPQRVGFAYPYDAQDDDDMPPVAEFETVPEVDPVVERKSRDAPLAPVDKTAPSTPRRDLTWEERAMAIERVPPADIPAWGPSGELGVDARSHAISEAMQDILEAKRRVEAKEAKVEKSREELSILKVDVELERKRLRQMRDDARKVQQMLRDLDLDIDDAARAYRYAQLQLKAARDEMAEVEARHWAVLSFYSPSQAKNGIEEAFREFEESEPAAKRFREKMMKEQKQQEQEMENKTDDAAGQERTEDDNASS
eukprot:scaffold14789_cov150-Amphora_coffeaeformis.AAC.1